MLEYYTYKCRPWPVIAKPQWMHNLVCPIIIGCISKGQCQSILRTSLHRVRLIEQVDMSHVKVPSETLFRFWGLLGAFESEFLIFASNRCGVKVIFPLSFSHLLVVEVQMRYDPERYVCKPKQASYCFTKDHEKRALRLLWQEVRVPYCNTPALSLRVAMELSGARRKSFGKRQAGPPSWIASVVLQWNFINARP